MNHNVSPYVLFPHTLLFESHYRHLSVLLPQLSILQVVRPPAVPDWAQEQFLPHPVIRESEKAEQVQMYLQAYRNLADLHGGEGILASLTQHWTKNDPMQESRFRIQSLLKGQGIPDERDINEWLFLEASVFLELARDLDEKEKELELGLFRLNQLEEEFREIVGITDEDELEEEVLETASPPLISDPHQLAFMIPKRIACWYRLAASRWPDPSPVPVAITGEVVEELLEPVRIARERTQETFEPLEADLATIPSLHRLSPEAFLALRQELETSGFPAAYRQDLQKVMENPGDASLHESLTASAETLSKDVELFCRKREIVVDGQISLKLTYVKDCTHRDLWKRMDKTGYEGLGTKLTTSEGVLLLSLKSV